MGTVVVKHTNDLNAVEYALDGTVIYDLDLRYLDTVSDLLQIVRNLREKQWYEDDTTDRTFSALNKLFEEVTGESFTEFLSASNISTRLEWAARREAHGPIVK